MARVKNTVSNIRRRNVALPLMAISIGIVLVIVFYFLEFRSQGLGIFKTQLDQITGEFEKVEKTYATLLTNVLSKRAPVPEFTLDVVSDSYATILTDVSTLESTADNQTSIDTLKTIVANRIESLKLLRTMNKTLRAEESIGNSLIAYSACKTNISFRQKPAQILAKLSLCKLELDNAVNSLKELPTASTIGCQLRHTPSYYLQRTLKSHNLLVSSYTYSSKGKAKEAASVEIEYQKVLSELRGLPTWNDCISAFLQTSATTLLGE